MQEGAAWAYRRYSHDPALRADEAQARAAKRTLWALPKPARVTVGWRKGER
jgi:endonuclease YncB( thermonuclease family)